MVAFKRLCEKRIVYKVVKTESNDRSRSRLTDLKTFDLSPTFLSVQSRMFANVVGEFKQMWSHEYFEGNWPTVRTVFNGIHDFYINVMESKMKDKQRV